MLVHRHLVKRSLSSRRAAVRRLLGMLVILTGAWLLAASPSSALGPRATAENSSGKTVALAFVGQLCVKKGCTAGFESPGCSSSPAAHTTNGRRRLAFSGRPQSRAVQASPTY